MGRKLPLGIKCYICGNKAERRDRNIDGIETGKYICYKHYMKDYNINIVRNDPNSRNNALKKISGRRTGNINPNCSSAKGDRFEDLSCKLFDAKSLNKDNDNFESPIDNWCKGLGYFQTKGATLRVISKWLTIEGEERCSKGWNSSFLNEHNRKIFDYLVYYCVSEDGKKIERIYIFPFNEIICRTGIGIYLNPSQYIQWYEIYRVKDEKVLEKANKLWEEINNGIYKIRGID